MSVPYPPSCLSLPSPFPPPCSLSFLFNDLLTYFLPFNLPPDTYVSLTLCVFAFHFFYHTRYLSELCFSCLSMFSFPSPASVCSSSASVLSPRSACHLSFRSPSPFLSCFLLPPSVSPSSVIYSANTSLILLVWCLFSSEPISSVHFRISLPVFPSVFSLVLCVAPIYCLYPRLLNTFSCSPVSSSFHPSVSSLVFPPVYVFYSFINLPVRVSPSCLNSALYLSHFNVFLFSVCFHHSETPYDTITPSLSHHTSYSLFLPLSSTVQVIFFLSSRNFLPIITLFPSHPILQSPFFFPSCFLSLLGFKFPSYLFLSLLPLSSLFDCLVHHLVAPIPSLHCLSSNLSPPSSQANSFSSLFFHSIHRCHPYSPSFTIFFF